MKILVIKTSALGDILQCFAVISYLKRAFPGAKIDWVVEESFACLLTAHREIRRVVILATKRWRRQLFSRQTACECQEMIALLRSERYDHIIDLQGNIKSALVTAAAKGKVKAGFSFAFASEWVAPLVLSHRYSYLREAPRARHYLELARQHFGKKVRCDEGELMRTELTLKPFESAWIEEVIKSPPDSIRFMICLGSAWENKKLALATWASFLTLLKGRLTPLFFFPSGTEAEKIEVRRLQTLLGGEGIALPRLTLPVWQRLMAKMDGVIALDSGALHLAATTATPSFGLFGPSLARCYQPSTKGRGSFQGKCPYGERFNQRCKKLRSCSTGACVKQIKAKSLARAFFSWWETVKRAIGD